MGIIVAVWEEWKVGVITVPPAWVAEAWGVYTWASCKEGEDDGSADTLWGYGDLRCGNPIPGICHLSDTYLTPVLRCGIPVPDEARGQKLKAASAAACEAAVRTIKNDPSMLPGYIPSMLIAEATDGSQAQVLRTWSQMLDPAGTSMVLGGTSDSTARALRSAVRGSAMQLSLYRGFPVVNEWGTERAQGYFARVSASWHTFTLGSVAIARTFGWARMGILVTSGDTYTQA